MPREIPIAALGYLVSETSLCVVVYIVAGLGQPGPGNVKLDLSLPQLGQHITDVC